MVEDSQDNSGKKLIDALQAERPLQIAGVTSAYAAIQAEQAGFKALYLSGAGVANYALGRPDDGSALTLEEVAIDARRILAVTSLPLLVDVDTGFDNPARTAEVLGRLGVAAIHIEDQIPAKLCGHLPGKQLVPAQEMSARIRAACKGAFTSGLVVMARCDAYSIEGLEGMMRRIRQYVEAGATMIFAEALRDSSHYAPIKEAAQVPLLANMTEFGVSPLAGTRELGQAGVDMVLYPLSAARAMAQATKQVFRIIREDGSQARALSLMQKRQDLYATLSYDAKVEQAAPMCEAGTGEIEKTAAGAGATKEIQGRQLGGKTGLESARIERKGSDKNGKHGQ